MGLSMFVRSSKVCADMCYSSVHEFRVKMILLTIGQLLVGKLKDNEDHTIRNELVSWLPEKLQDELGEKEPTLKFVREKLVQDNGTPAYEGFMDSPIVHSAGHAYQMMAGLYKLVNHSDCDGLHTAGDCVDILKFLKFVKPALALVDDTTKDQWDNTYNEIITQWFNEVLAVFTEAVENEQEVIYG